MWIDIASNTWENFQGTIKVLPLHSICKSKLSNSVSNLNSLSGWLNFNRNSRDQTWNFAWLLNSINDTLKIVPAVRICGCFQKTFYYKFFFKEEILLFYHAIYDIYSKTWKHFIKMILTASDKIFSKHTSFCFQLIDSNPCT